MTLKEQAYRIIGGFTEKQFKGFADLFSEPEPGEGHSETDRIMEKLARAYLGSFDDPLLEKETQELIGKLRAKGYSKIRAYLYAYGFKIGEYKEYLRITMSLINHSYSIEHIAELADKPVKEIESMVELLVQENLIES